MLKERLEIFPIVFLSPNSMGAVAEADASSPYKEPSRLSPHKEPAPLCLPSLQGGPRFKRYVHSHKELG